jgi:hypothetical protein
MDFVVIAKLNTTFLEMLDPIEARILNLWWKILLHSTILNVSHERPWPTDTIDISLEKFGHELYTAGGKRSVRSHLVNPEIQITAPIFVE